MEGCNLTKGQRVALKVLRFVTHVLHKSCVEVICRNGVLPDTVSFLTRPAHVPEVAPLLTLVAGLVEGRAVLLSVRLLGAVAVSPTVTTGLARPCSVARTVDCSDVNLGGGSGSNCPPSQFAALLGLDLLHSVVKCPFLLVTENVLLDLLVNQPGNKFKLDYLVCIGDISLAVSSLHREVTPGGEATESGQIMTNSFILLLGQTEELLYKHSWVLIPDCQLFDVTQ